MGREQHMKISWDFWLHWILLPSKKKKSSFEMKEKKDIERSTFENFTSVMDYFSETLS